MFLPIVKISTKTVRLSICVNDVKYSGRREATGAACHAKKGRKTLWKPMKPVVYD